MLKKSKYSNLFLLTCLAANVLSFPVFAELANEKSTLVIGNDDTEFVFAGRCPNGDSYRIFSHQIEIDGLTHHFMTMKVLQDEEP